MTVTCREVERHQEQGEKCLGLKSCTNAHTARTPAPRLLLCGITFALTLARGHIPVHTVPFTFPRKVLLKDTFVVTLEKSLTHVHTVSFVQVVFAISDDIFALMVDQSQSQREGVKNQCNTQMIMVHQTRNSENLCIFNLVVKECMITT